MNFLFDIYNRVEQPSIILYKNNFEKDGVLGLAYDKKLTIRLTDLSELSFTYPQKFDDVNTPYYDNIKTKKIIYIPEIGYFKLEKVKINSDGIKEVKECVAYSIQCELKQKQLINFSGTYKLYDTIEPKKSLMGILINYFPSWSIDVVDSSLWSIYRTFDITQKDIYSFLMDEVMTSYNCVVLFDIQTRKISVKAMENISKETDIYISFDNLMKSAEIDELSDEIVTALRVKGGSDEMDIIAVNPNGSDSIYNFSYYKTSEWMSQSLINALNTYESKYNSLKSTYLTKLTTLKSKNTTLLIKENELVDLENELSALITIKKTRIQGGLSLTDINSQISSKKSQINTKENEINSLKSEINILKTDLNNIVSQLKLENNFTTTQLNELDSFIIEQFYQDSTFIITDNMTETEKIEKKQELYDYSSNMLIRLSQPRFSFSISSTNFVFLKEYEKFMQQLELGCLITTELREDYIVKPILLEIEIDFENDNNFNLKFGNRYKLSDGTFSFADLMSQTSNASSTISFEKFKYKEWSENSKDAVTEFINSSLNCAKNAVTSSQNQEVLINEHGVQCREIDTATGQFKPEQLWIINNMIAMSKDSFNTADVAIGKIQDSRYGSLWGISAPLLVGKILTGNNLRIENNKNSFVLDENGCVLTNASFTLTTTDAKSKAILTPSSIKFQGNVGGTWTDQLYYSNGNLKIKGELVAGSIVSNSTISGGSLNINNKCIIDSFGYLTATGATITGEINATSGEISGDLEVTGSLNGGYIYGSTISTTQDIRVGNNIYLNATTYEGKMIQFNPKTFIHYVGLHQKLSIESESGISILSRGELNISSTDDIRFALYGGNMILPYNSYLGVKNNSNKIARQGDLDGFLTSADVYSKTYIDNNFADISHTHSNYIRPRYSANICHIDYSEDLERLYIRPYGSSTAIGYIEIITD